MLNINNVQYNEIKDLPFPKINNNLSEIKKIIVSCDAIGENDEYADFMLFKNINEIY